MIGNVEVVLRPVRSLEEQAQLTALRINSAAARDWEAAVHILECNGFRPAHVRTVHGYPSGAAGKPKQLLADNGVVLLDQWTELTHKPGRAWCHVHTRIPVLKVPPAVSEVEVL